MKNNNYEKFCLGHNFVAEFSCSIEIWIILPSFYGGFIRRNVIWPEDIFPKIASNPNSQTSGKPWKVQSQRLQCFQAILAILRFKITILNYHVLHLLFSVINLHSLQKDCCTLMSELYLDPWEPYQGKGSGLITTFLNIFSIQNIVKV